MSYPSSATRAKTIDRGEWWRVNSTERIFYAGIDSAGFATDASVSGAAVGGRTFISGVVSERCRQDGVIRQCKIRISVCDPNSQIKFKVFRPSGATYDFISESEAFPITTTGNHTFIPATPLVCAPGDVFGIWLNDVDLGTSVAVKTREFAPDSLRYTAGDITSNNAFASLISNFSLCVEAAGAPPYLAVTGDSIPEGHNTAHSFYHAGPSGESESAAEIANQLRGLIANTFEYQNHAMGGTTFAWAASTGAISAIATKAKVILLHSGVNDVSTERSWANVESDLDTIKAALTVGQHLYVDEILPWTAGTDANALTIRGWNGNLATWCAANGATLIRCHDAMGQVRGSTGEIDDLLTAYDEDKVHLLQAGVDKMAAIWKLAL